MACCNLAIIFIYHLCTLQLSAWMLIQRDAAVVDGVIARMLFIFKATSQTKTISGNCIDLRWSLIVN